MPSKRQVFDLLSQDELVELGRHDLLVRVGRRGAQPADALAGHGPALLAGLPLPPERHALQTQGVRALQSRPAADAQVELR